MNPAEVLSQVMRLEQALAAVSKGINERIAAGVSTAAVQVEPAASPAEDTAAAPRDGVLLPSSADERLSETPQPAREVARLEDVLKADPARNKTAETVPEPNAAVSLETATTDEVTDVVAAVAVPTSLPSSVSAQALREAFWFEQASAFKPASELAATSEVVATDEVAATNEVAATSEVAATPTADVVEVLPAPVSASPVEPGPCDAAAQPVAESTGWGTAIFLLALLALIMLLTGRKPR